MPPPSYPHRHLLLTGLLDSLSTPCPPDAFAVDGASNERGCKLDALLLEGWTATGSKAQLLDKDVLQHAETLRLKKNDFDVLGRVGEGQFGVVDAVRCKLNGKVYAMKSIEKTMVMRAGSQLNLSLERHIHGLASVTSPAPTFTASFQSPTSLHLVTSFAPCGSLWDRLCEMLPEPGLDTGRMEEEEVGWWARQMVDAISWLHGRGYVHRDIKPHNFLLLSDCRLWLTDFGTAAPLTNGAVPRRLCLLPTGTPDYVAPEVLRIAEDALVEAAHSDADESNGTIRRSMNEGSGYGPEVDWWSLGATLYEMSAGRAPFFSPSIGNTYERIMRCDVRMPGDLCPALKSLLSGLLSPLDVRLGNGDVGQIRKHSFFRGVDWSKLGAPPPGLVCTPLDLGTLADEFDHSAEDDITFEHFFNTTVGCSTMSPMSTAAGAPVTWGRWVGWTLDPPADFFGSDPPPAIKVSPPTLKPGAGTVRQHSAPPATHLFTPLRPGLRGVTPPTVPRTAPRSVPRTRPVSERQAFAELVKCVQASARKKLASTTIKIVPSSASSASSAGSAGWRKDHPPTPTPVSRDVTVLTATLLNGRNGDRPSSRASMRTGDELSSRPMSRNSLYVPDRPLSRTSMRDEASPMFPPRPLSRASSARDARTLQLPPRTFSRTTSLPVWDEPARPAFTKRSNSGSSSENTITHRPSFSAVQASTPKEDTRSQRPSVRVDSASRSVSLASVRGSDRVPRASTPKDDTFLAKLCAVDANESRPTGPGSRGSRSASSSSLSSGSSSADRTVTLPAKPPSPVQSKTTTTATATSKRAPPAHYVLPRDPDPLKEGDRYESMKIWHEGLEDGFANLERRFADLMNMLGRDP